jgi:hypothetical protein
MTVVPAIAATAAAAISEYFFFKVFPLCRSGDGAFSQSYQLPKY